jgi:hypothetical protein
MVSLNPIVIELDPVPDRLLALLPARLLEAPLGQRRALMKQPIVLVEAVDQHPGDGFGDQIVGRSQRHGAYPGAK